LLSCFVFITYSPLVNELDLMIFILRTENKKIVIARY
jgi:hypothetical protein